MHPDERPADARYRATSNVSSPAPRTESGPSPSRSQAQVARQRIVYAVLIPLGVLLMLVGGGRHSPQLYVLGILVLVAVSLHHKMRTHARKARARSAKGRASAPTPATASTQTAARPVVAHPPPLTDAYDAIIRETHRKSGSPDGQPPPALPPRSGPAGVQLVRAAVKTVKDGRSQVGMRRNLGPTRKLKFGLPRVWPLVRPCS